MDNQWPSAFRPRYLALFSLNSKSLNTVTLIFQAVTRTHEMKPNQETSANYIVPTVKSCKPIADLSDRMWEAENSVPGHHCGLEA